MVSATWTGDVPLEKDTLFLTQCLSQLQRWTGANSARLVFSSLDTPCTADALFARIADKPNVAVIGFTTDGDVFGGFYSVAVTETDRYFYDPDMFAFSFESHGRCMTPQRFAVKPACRQRSAVWVYSQDPRGFIYFGVDCTYFTLGNQQSNSLCQNVSHAFASLRDTTLTGTNGSYLVGPFHHCVHLLAVQLLTAV